MTKNSTKVYSLKINNGIINAKFLGTLSGKNIVRTNPGTRFIKSRANKTIRYELLDDFTKKEISFLELQIREALDLTEKTINKLKAVSLDALEAMTDVFLRYDEEARTAILKRYSEIYGILSEKLRFKRKQVFEEKNKKFGYVYISTNPDNQTSTIYDKFFEHDEYSEKIFTRPTLLIHEAAHITGLREEAGSEVLLNAENYRKFVCILLGIANFEEMFPSGNMGKTNPLKSNIGRIEFPNPDQPRDGNGRWKKSAGQSGNIFVKFNDDMEIKSNDKNEIWGAIHISINDLKPNAPYTVRITAEYEQYGFDGEKIDTVMDNNNPSWAYDAKSDADGNINLKRVGLLGQDYNNRVSDYQGENIKGSIKVDVYEGRFYDNFNKADKVIWNKKALEDMPPKDIELHNKYGLGSYGAAHASNNAYIDEEYLSGEYGGGIYGQEAKKSPTKSDTYMFDFKKATNKSILKKSGN